jgi:uncharacterized membrane protein
MTLEVRSLERWKDQYLRMIDDFISAINSSRDSFSRGQQCFIYLLIFAIASFPRFYLLFSKCLDVGLDYDELQTVTHAYLPIDQIFISIKTFDPHPPLYYVHLHYWLFFGTSDLWIKINSMVWGIATALSLFYISRKIFDVKRALLATILFSLAPYSIFYATEARMYAFVAFISLWGWYFTHNFFTTKSYILHGFVVILLETIFILSHGAGFFFLISIISYGIILTINRTKIDKQLFFFYLSQLMMIGIYAIIWLPRAKEIHLGHLLIPGFHEVIEALTVLFFGFWMPRSGWGFWLSLTILVLILINILFQPKYHSIYLPFFIIPLLSGIFISYAIRPIWEPKSFAYLSPFISLIFALSVTTQVNRIKPLVKLYKTINIMLVWGVVSGLVLGIIFQQKDYIRWWAIKKPVEYVQEFVSDKDIIFIASERLFWGWGWYFTGPGSVNPLESEKMISTESGVRITRVSTQVSDFQELSSLWFIARDVDTVDYEKFLGDDFQKGLLEQNQFSKVLVKRYRVNLNEFNGMKAE